VGAGIQQRLSRRENFAVVGHGGSDDKSSKSGYKITSKAIIVTDDKGSLLQSTWEGKNVDKRQLRKTE
jgi:hypothetical protein